MSFHHWLTVTLTLGIGFLGFFWVFTTPQNVDFFDRRYGSRLMRICLMILSIGLSVISAFNFPIPNHEIDHIITLLGIVLYAAGLILAVWAKTTMGTYWGMASQHDLKRQNKLLTEGPFSITRNPIYTGLLLVFVGFSLAIKSWFIFLAGIYYWSILRAAQKEEGLLEKYFGQKYRDYKSKVPRFLGPPGSL